MHAILLASSSPYRREILAKLGLIFEWASPDIDETPLPNESAEDLVVRLSLSKALALKPSHPSRLIIASDQVAVLEDKILGKPLTNERAFAQLRAASGKPVVFKTGLCLLNAASGETQTSVETYEVNFNPLSDEQIHHYLNIEEPYDCAGSFKCEGLGIALFSRLQGEDFNTLIGLPLIRLCEMLRNEGLDPLLVARKPKG
jgi:septum formation protein